MDKDALPAANVTGSFIYKEQSFTVSLDIGGRLDFALTEHAAFLVDLRVSAV
ncbi:MAG: hypothetical protein LBO65_07200 [Spirochaetaceae bacterium]|jgi:hypothetical protein|nr:hypothetical protein [Spirochaetaceae bacterium]